MNRKFKNYIFIILIAFFSTTIVRHMRNKIIDFDYNEKELNKYYYNEAWGARRPSKINEALIGSKVIAKVVDVYSVDLVQVKLLHSRYQVKLSGLSLTENYKGHRLISKEFTKHLILGKTVTLLVKDIDEKSKLISELFLDDLNVNVELIKTGNALYSESDSRVMPMMYQEAEEYAKENSLGLWQFKKVSELYEWKEPYRVWSTD